MNIRGTLGIVVDHTTNDMLDLMLTERFGQIGAEKGPELKEKLAEKDKVIHDLVMQHYSDDKEECDKFLNMLIDCECEEQENYYLYGIRDAIRFIKEIMRI